jgi:hypothetical protein
MSRLLRIGFCFALTLATFSLIAAPQAAHAAVGDVDQAVKMVGTSTDWASTPSGNAISPYVGTNAMTMEAWVNSSTGCTPDASVMGFENVYAIWCSGGSWYTSFYSGSWINTKSNSLDVANAWTHLALTRDSSGNWNFYVNGALVNNGTQATVGNSAGVLYVGALPGRAYWTGMIDEVKYWSVARTQTQIQSDMNTYGNGGDSGLQLYYSFNDTSGNGTQNIPNLGSMANETLTVNIYSSIQNYPDIRTIDTTTAVGYSIVKFPRSYITANGGWKVPTNTSSLKIGIIGGGGGGSGGGWNSGVCDVGGGGGASLWHGGGMQGSGGSSIGGNGSSTGVLAGAAVVNTGSGGGGGASGGGPPGAGGGSGSAGMVIIKYKNYFGSSISISVNPKKTTKSAGSTPITATTTSTGTVTFYANYRVINGCLNVAVSGTTATCNWRPITQGQVTLSATYTSNDPLYSGTAAATSFVTSVGKRTTAR